MKLTLREALAVLSKASPFSVRTVTEKPVDQLDSAKEWLYIEQDIERDFNDKLAELNAGEVIFLCGSSGDGKSEILARCHHKFCQDVRFHLDATHSFSPRQSAIQALDELFDDVISNPAPLVVGINIGMLANYANEGAARHALIKEQIDIFLAGGKVESSYTFLNFENYSKFQYSIVPNASGCKFAKQLMQRLTAPNPENPFFELSQKEAIDLADQKLLSNYRLLSVDEVQDAIIVVLFKARLIKDQFITARGLLDFVHHLLTGSGYLADNLFEGGENELIQRMSEFDPALIRTRELDQFVLLFDLGVDIPGSVSFLDCMREKGWIGELADSRGKNGVTLVRTFYLLSKVSIDNDFHLRFAKSFEEDVLNDFAKIWVLHTTFDGTNSAKAGLREFYTQELISAIFRHANRNAPSLNKGEMFLGKAGELLLAAPIDLRADFVALAMQRVPIVSRFIACLKISDVSLAPVAINLNLFELITKLNKGYRPNKYDKNAVVLLDELIDQIVNVAKQSDSLRFYDGLDQFTARLIDDVIEVSGV